MRRRLDPTLYSYRGGRPPLYGETVLWRPYGAWVDGSVVRTREDKSQG